MTASLPPHDDIDLSLEDAGAAMGASATHGLLAGLACAGLQLPRERLAQVLSDELDLPEPPAPLLQALGRLDSRLRQQLADDELGFELLLPDDEEPLEARVKAMADWCDGFLGGFGLGCGELPPRRLPEDVRSLLQTFGEFARAELGGEEDEAAEKDYAELVEYLRMATLTIYTELATPRETGGGVVH